MSVKTLSFGQELPNSRNTFLRLKQKGDKVQFKIAQEPVYMGKHFIQTENGWNVPECPRIATNNDCNYCDNDCDYCEQYFSIMSEVKKMKALDKSLKDSSPKIKKLLDKAYPFKVTIEFYFPILDRGDKKFKILQTTNGVRNKFNAQFQAGIDVMNTEWILMNTGSTNPNERYMLTPVDSAKVTEMSENEVVEWEKAKKYDLSVIGGDSKKEE